MTVVLLVFFVLISGRASDEVHFVKYVEASLVLSTDGRRSPVPGRRSLDVLGMES